MICEFINGVTEDMINTKEVAKTKIAVKLQPMNSFERRVIHEKLSDWRDIYTESEGEGESRAIVIKPKNKENN